MVGKKATIMTSAEILIVEDEQPVAEAVAERLERLGYTVCATVSSGQQAVETAAERRPALALIDLGLAGDVDGPDVAEQMRQRFDVPVIYLTDDAAGDLLQRAEGTQPFGYLLKPVEARQARLVIETALYRHRKERGLQQTIDELQHQTQLFQTIFDSIADGVVVIENDKVPSADAMLFNPRAKEIMGIGPTATGPEQWAEEYGLFQTDQVTPIPTEQQGLVRAMNGEATNEGEMFLRNRARPDGLYIRGSARPLMSDTGVCKGGVIVFRDLTAQREAERKLQETVDKLQHQAQIMQAVFDSMSDGVVAVDTNGTRLLFNPGAERILGLNIRTSKKIDQWAERYGIFYPDQVTPIPSDQLPLVRATHGSTTDEQEVFVRNSAKPEGVYVSVNSRPILNDAGEPIGGVSVYRDVTALKATDNRLKETFAELQYQTQLMHTIFENMGEGVIIADKNGKEILCNPGVERIRGIGLTDSSDPAEWVKNCGMYCPDKVTPFPVDDLPSVRAKRGEATLDQEMFIRNHKKPEGVHTSITGNPIRGESGDVQGTVVVIRDVTRQKEAESKLQDTVEQLQHQTRLFQAIFNSMSDGVIVSDVEGKQLLFNPSAQRIVGLGTSHSDLEQWPEEYGIFFPDKVTPIPADELALARAIRGESTDHVEQFVRNPSKPAGVYVSVSGRPLQDEAGTSRGGVIVLHDVTERVRADEALSRAFAQGRMEVVETILHNIGNAITSAAIGIGTLHDQLGDSRLLHRFSALAQAVEAHQADWGEYVQRDPQGRQVRPFLLAFAEDLTRQNEQLMQTIERVKSRVDHIVDIVRTQRSVDLRGTAPQDVNLRKTVLEAVSLLQEALTKRNVDVRVDCDRAPEKIRVQASQFHQMLVNLIKNAMEANDQLAQLGELEGQPRIGVRAYSEQAFLVLEVADNGIGIDRENVRAIFAAGYTTKPNGTGLGLHSVANFVNRCGGRIQTLSDGFGKGTTLRVMLRLAAVGREPAG